MQVRAFVPPTRIKSKILGISTSKERGCVNQKSNLFVRCCLGSVSVVKSRLTPHINTEI